MNAADVASACGDASREGRTWRARCPLHNGRSLLLTDTKAGLRYRCAGGCDGRELSRELRRMGLLNGSTDVLIPASAPAQRFDKAQEDAERTAAALNIWRQCSPAAGTLAEVYLRSRGITITPPPSLRFHPSLLHTPTGQRLPAMVAGVQSIDRRVVAIHRTYLSSDGTKANVESPKMTYGPRAGGAVRLAAAGPVLAIAEGLETALSYQQPTGIPTWSGLCADGITSMTLPALPLGAEITIAADRDENNAGIEAAQAAAARWTKEGRAVRVALPPALPGKRKVDFNDLLMARAIALQEAA